MRQEAKPFPPAGSLQQPLLRKFDIVRLTVGKYLKDPDTLLQSRQKERIWS